MSDQTAADLALAAVDHAPLLDNLHRLQAALPTMAEQARSREVIRFQEDKGTTWMLLAGEAD